MAGLALASAAMIALGLTMSAHAKTPSRLSAAVASDQATARPSGPISQGQTVPPAMENITPPQSYGPPMTAASQATSRALSDSQEFQGVTRAGAKLTTWSNFVSSSAIFNQGGPESTLQQPGTESVWVVAIAGTVVPEFGNGHTYPWGVIVYDANTNAVLTMMAGPSGTWPSWFDAMPGNSS